MAAPVVRNAVRVGAMGALALAAAILPCRASDEETPWYRQIAVNAFLSTSYSYNFNRPESRANAFRVFDFDDNSFKFDVGELVVQKAVAKPREVGFRVDLTDGSSIPPVVAAADPQNAGSDPKYWDVQQAFGSWIAPVDSGLRLDFGKFVTPFGYELIDGYDGYNDNATRSFLFGYAIPFTHTGVRASYAFNGTVSAMFMLVNGWDNGTDNNSGKTVGAQITLTPSDTVAIYLDGITGPERDNDSNRRSVLEADVTWKTTSLMTLGANVDWGKEQDVPLSPTLSRDASWSGVALYAKFALTPQFALAARVEQFEDLQGWRTGTAQKLREATLTPEFRVNPHLVFRVDLRTDWSSVQAFETADGGSAQSQTTVLANALVVF